MTRVLHVSWEYPPLVHGGLGRYVDALARAQAARGDTVTVLTCGSSGAASEEVVAGVRVLRAPAVPVDAADLVGSTTTLEDALLAHGLGVLAAGTFDVVHSHDWMTAAAGRRLAAHLDARWVHGVHATEHGRRAGRLDDATARAVHAREVSCVTGPDALVVCSGSMAVEVREVLGADPRVVQVVPAAVDAPLWDLPASQVAAARRRWADGVPLVATVGRLEWEKGMSTLLRAVPALLERHPSACVVVAGDGSYRPTLEALTAQLGVQVVMPGRLRQDDLAGLLAAADVVVVPSRYEPFGLVALEAQAAGACVVVTDTGGLAESVRDDVTGRTVGVGDVDALAAVVVDLLDDPAQRERLGRAGRDVAVQRTWADVAGRLDAVYRGGLGAAAAADR